MSNFPLGVPEIHGQSRGVFRPRGFWRLAAMGEKVSQCGMESIKFPQLCYCLKKFEFSNVNQNVRNRVVSHRSSTTAYAHLLRFSGRTSCLSRYSSGSRLGCLHSFFTFYLIVEVTVRNAKKIAENPRNVVIFFSHRWSSKMMMMVIHLSGWKITRCILFMHLASLCRIIIICST